MVPPLVGLDAGISRAAPAWGLRSRRGAPAGYVPVHAQTAAFISRVGADGGEVVNAEQFDNYYTRWIGATGNHAGINFDGTPNTRFPYITPAARKIVGGRVTKLYDFWGNCDLTLIAGATGCVVTDGPAGSYLTFTNTDGGYSFHNPVVLPYVINTYTEPILVWSHDDPSSSSGSAQLPNPGGEMFWFGANPRFVAMYLGQTPGFTATSTEMVGWWGNNSTNTSSNSRQINGAGTSTIGAYPTMAWAAGDLLTLGRRTNPSSFTGGQLSINGALRKASGFADGGQTVGEIPKFTDPTWTDTYFALFGRRTSASGAALVESATLSGATVAKPIRFYALGGVVNSGNFDTWHDSYYNDVRELFGLAPAAP